MIIHRLKHNFWHIFRLQAATATAFQDSSSDLINRYHFQFGHITIPDRPPRTGSSRHTCNRFAPSKSHAEKFRGQDWRVAATPAADRRMPGRLRRGSCGAGAGGSTPSARPEGSAFRRSHFKRHIVHLYYLGHLGPSILWRCLSSKLPGSSRAILKVFLTFTMAEQIKMTQFLV